VKTLAWLLAWILWPFVYLHREYKYRIYAKKYAHLIEEEAAPDPPKAFPPPPELDKGYVLVKPAPDPRLIMYQAKCQRCEAVFKFPKTAVYNIDGIGSQGFKCPNCQKTGYLFLAHRL
jgi:hypothetical protein